LELDTRTLSDDLQHVIQSLRRCDPLDFGKRTQVGPVGREAACNKAVTANKRSAGKPKDAKYWQASWASAKTCVLLPKSSGSERLLAVTALLQAASRPTGPSFEWIDGPLVAAIKQGHWFFINDKISVCPDVLPFSLRDKVPFNSHKLLSRSRTDGLHKLASLMKNQWPCLIAATNGL
jgi:hypothetical protein